MGDEAIPFSALGMVFGILQMQTTYFGHLFTKHIHDFSWLIGKGNRLKLWELIVVVIGFSIDDIGTAVGQQATELPRIMYEGNPHMVSIWKWLIASGFATSTTDAHRIIYIIFMVQLFINQYFGLMNPYGRIYYLYTALLKTYAGYNWWFLEPNDYTIFDFLFFKSGEPRLERMSDAKRNEWNKMLFFENAQKLMRGTHVTNWNKSTRRRMFPTKDYVEPEPYIPTPAETNGAIWLSKVLPVFFGAI